MAMKPAKPAKLMRKAPEADDVLITTPRGDAMMAAQRRAEAAKAAADVAKRARADVLLGIARPAAAKKPQVVSTTVNYRPTPTKKK